MAHFSKGGVDGDTVLGVEEDGSQLGFCFRSEDIFMMRHSVWMGLLLGGCLEGGWVGSLDLGIRKKRPPARLCAPKADWCLPNRDK